MPTYEYACRECGEHLEVVQKFTDDALTECPACHGSLRKVFGTIGIAFKGSGFYKNDSRSDNGSKSKDKEKEPAKAESSSSGSDTKSDTKSDAKSNAKSNAKKAESPAKSDSGNGSSTAAAS